MVDNSVGIKTYSGGRGIRPRTFDDLFDEVQRSFGDWIRPFFESFPSLSMFEPWPSDTRIPYVNIEETENEYNMSVELPGVSKDDIEVKVTDDNVVEISGKRSEEKKETKGNYLRQERSSYNFHRSVSLPEEINGDKVEARVENGVLYLRLPKKEDASRKVKKVEIK